MSHATPFPVHLEGRMDPDLSRWLWLVKWVLIIPHLIVLVFLWAAFVVLSLVAFVAVAVRGRYPRSIFEFNLGVLRWTWRVDFYAYSALGTDRYPPFTLADVPEHPARLDIAYPEHLPRGLALVRWWLIALPHYVIALAFAGGGTVIVAGAGDWPPPVQFGVITLLTLMGGVALLFTGRYPQELFAGIVGINRWVLRAAAYAALMTDAYPPFRLDTGPDEPGRIALPERPTAAAAPVATGPRSGGRIVALVAGSLLALIGLGMVAGGAGTAIVSAVARDDDGFLGAPERTYTASGYAYTSERHELTAHDVPVLPDLLDLLGTVRVRADGDRPVFMGIARTADVREYLGGAGRAPAVAPGDAGIWVAAASGTGERELRFEPRSGDWTFVLMNADGSRGVRAELQPAARLPHLGAVGAGVLGAGLVVILVSAALLVGGLRREVQP